MTNERCSEILQLMKFMIDKDNYSDEVEEALDLAIKALDTIPEQPDICPIYGGVCGYPIEACSECPKHGVVEKMLEQQPSEDCISREAVIRLVEQYPNIIGNRCSGLIADIKHLPSVTPQQRWIPVSERLPEDDKEVLCYSPSAGIFIGTYYEGVFEGDSGWTDDVVAWMELPQPYKEDKG